MAHAASNRRNSLKAAREAFELVNDHLDGEGVVVEDLHLLARGVATYYGVKPEDVYEEYADPDAEDEDGQ